MTPSSMDPARVGLPRPLYAHVVAATLLQCVVVVTALASRSMAAWVAGLLLTSTLAVAAHSAHVHRDAAATGAPR